MKRYINSSESVLTALHFTDLFDHLAAIVYVDDINTSEDVLGSSYIQSSSHDDYSDLDLFDLTAEEIRDIDDLNVIYRLNQLRPTDLSKRQKKMLAQQYRLDPDDPNSSGIRVYLDDSDVQKILNMLKEHRFVQGPIYRHNEPDKNFAMKHNLNIGPQDYANILHTLTVSECRIITPYKTFSYSDKHPGNELIVFNVDRELQLASGQSIGNFKIYIKIDLTRTISSNRSPIALISFHE